MDVIYNPYHATWFSEALISTYRNQKTTVRILHTCSKIWAFNLEFNCFVISPCLFVPYFPEVMEEHEITYRRLSMEQSSQFNAPAAFSYRKSPIAHRKAG